MTPATAGTQSPGVAEPVTAVVVGDGEAPATAAAARARLTKSNNSRRKRGRESEHVVRNYLLPWFPGARVVESFAAGQDVSGCGRLSVEVKATRKFSPLGWIKQAVAQQQHADDIPVVILRCPGQGEKSVAEWPALLPLATFMRLAEKAGYTTEKRSGA